MKIKLIFIPALILASCIIFASSAGAQPGGTLKISSTPSGPAALLNKLNNGDHGSLIPPAGSFKSTSSLFTPTISPTSTNNGNFLVPKLPVTALYSTFSSTKMGFKINYPTGWVIKNLNTTQMNIVNPKDGSGLFISVISASGLTLNDVISEFVGATKNNNKGLTIVSQYPSTLGGTPAETFIIEYEGAVREIDIITVKNNIAYSVIVGAKDASFDQYSGIFNSIIQSFQFLT